MLPLVDNISNDTQMNIDDNGGNMNNFNDNQGFDANVDADSETEPKKYIQQLTGKLSQELRKFNQEDNNQDNELNKYVLGMLIPQATKSMNDSDKNEIVKKIQKGNIEDFDDTNNSNDNFDDDIPLTSESKITNSTIESLANETQKYRLKKKLKINNNPFIINH